MKKISILFSLFVFSISTYSYTLTGFIPKQGNRIHYVALFDKTQFELLDSVVTDNKGNFSIDIPSRYKGIVKVILKDNRMAKETINASIDTQTLYLFLDGSDFSFKAYWGLYSEDLQIGLGKAPTDAIEKMSVYLNNGSKRLNLICKLLDTYTASDSIAKVLGCEYKREILNEQSYCDSLSNEFPDSSLVRTSISLLKPLYIPIELNQKGKDAWRVEHFFDHMNLKDENILHLPDFFVRMNEYMNICKPIGLSKTKDIDSNIVDAAQRILKLTKENKDLNQGVYAILENILIRENKAYLLEKI